MTVFGDLYVYDIKEFKKKISGNILDISEHLALTNDYKCYDIYDWQLINNEVDKLVSNSFYQKNENVYRFYDNFNLGKNIISAYTLILMI